MKVSNFIIFEYIYNFLDPLAVVESVKGTSDVYCPITGTVIAINSSLIQKPSTLNKSAENDGWLCEIEIERNEFSKTKLLNQCEYASYCKNTK